MSDQKTKQDTEKLESLPTTDSSIKFLPEIRMILIGGRPLGGIEASGKTSVGNIILRRNAFEVGKRTARSLQASAHVHGRHLTVVDTPGWWWHYTTDHTPKFDSMEFMKSPTLCPPGPHVFLLVIPVDSAFPNIYKMALENQLEPLTETVWRHIIVVFSSVAPYDERTYKSHLRKWPDLLHVQRKCQNKHVLNINNTDDDSQVIVLLEKIEKMVARNNGHYYEIGRILSLMEMAEARESDKKKTLSVKTPELHTHLQDEKDNLTDIQIVILGASWASRSSAGNIILGKDAFEVDEARTTIRCAVSRAEAHGRQLTVVDTPGWYCYNPVKKTSELDRLEIKRSVYLCPPGPHVILLTVPIAIAFDKLYQKAVEEHMGLLGKNIWSHTIVLFTRGDWLGDTTFEERIEIEGEHLQWLLEQCGHRYHVLNCKQHTDNTQVTQLFEKIDAMVMENHGRVFAPELRRNPSVEYELKMERAKRNIMKVRRQRNILQELLKERKNILSEVNMVLLGGEEVGKSTIGNIILQGHLFKNRQGQQSKSQCVKQERKVEGCQVSVVDTPDWPTSTPQKAKEIQNSVTLCTPGPHAFLLVLSIREPFTKTSQRTAEDLMRLFGQNVWRHTIIVFYNGLWMRDRAVEEYIACEESLQELVSKCGNRYHVLVNDWTNRSQVRDLLKMIEEMVARNRGEHFTREKHKRKSTTSTLSESKTLTEEEWMKREDELLEKMLNAAVVDLEAEDFDKPFPRRRQSFDKPIPSISGESCPDSKRLSGGSLNPVSKVSEWLLQHHNESLSGYDTMSITSEDLMEEMQDDKLMPIPTHL